jgi:hypothetical protein
MEAEFGCRSSLDCERCRGGREKKKTKLEGQEGEMRAKEGALFFSSLDVCVERDMWQVGEKRGEKNRQNDAAWRSTFALKNSSPNARFIKVYNSTKGYVATMR